MSRVQLLLTEQHLREEVFMQCIVLGFLLYFPVNKTAKNARRGLALETN